MFPQQKIEQALEAPLQQLEKERKKVLNKLSLNIVQGIASILVSLVIGITFLSLFSHIGETFGLATVIFVPLLGGIAYAIYKHFDSRAHLFQKQFETRVKTEVYQEVFKTWKENSIYLPQKHIARTVFKKSGLYGHHDDYQGDDYVQGKLEDGRSFQFSELLVRKRTNRKGENNDNFETIFKGLFFVLEGPHVLQSLLNPTVIKPRKQDDYYKQQKQQRKRQLSQLKSNKHNDGILDANFSASLSSQKEAEEATLFDQLFTIVSPEQWTVKRKLPQKFYDHLTHLRAQLRQQITMSFQRDRLYIGVAHQFDFWVVNVKESLVSPQRLRYLAWNFALAFEILEKIAESTQAE